MSRDLRKMDWLYHVDLDIAKHHSKADIQRSAGIAWDTIQYHNPPKPGDLMVVVVVRPSKAKKKAA